MSRKKARVNVTIPADVRELVAYLVTVDPKEKHSLKEVAEYLISVGAKHLYNEGAKLANAELAAPPAEPIEPE